MNRRTLLGRCVAGLASCLGVSAVNADYQVGETGHDTLIRKSVLAFFRPLMDADVISSVQVEQTYLPSRAGALSQPNDGGDVFYYLTIILYQSERIHRLYPGAPTTLRAVGGNAHSASPRHSPQLYVYGEFPTISPDWSSTPQGIGPLCRRLRRAVDEYWRQPVTS